MKTKWVIYDMPSLNLSFIFHRKVTLKISISLPYGAGREVPTTLLKLPKYWVIDIGDNVC